MLFSVLFVSSAHGYGVETHALLTKEIVSFYNSKYSNYKISDELASYLIDGARHEDTNPRYLNHFYDPVNDRGLADGVFSGQGSKYWAQDEDNQSALLYKFFVRTANTILTGDQLSKVNSTYYQTNFTWQKAIDLYAQDKKEEAIFALGHILHLIEDAAVPDHTRNDAHPPFDDGGSPYENWTKRFDLKNPDPELSNRLNNKNPYLFGDLNGYFDSMANYSNNNFYSRDSIGSFDLIEISHYQKVGNLNYGMVSDGLGEYKLFVGGNFEWNKNNIQTINHPAVLNDYWSRLSTKAVQHGAGVLDLFFDEAELAKEKLVREKTGRPYLGLLADGFENLFSGNEIIVENIISTPLPVLAVITEPTSTPIITAVSTPRVSPIVTPTRVPDPTILPTVSPQPTNLPLVTPTVSLIPSPISSPVPSPIYSQVQEEIWLSGVQSAPSSSIVVEATPTLVEEPTESPSPEPTPETTPEILPESTPEVSPDPTPEPIIEPEPTPTIEPSPMPSPSPSYLSGLDFYKSDDEKYYLELSWNSYPFIPIDYGHLISGVPANNNWHVIIFYYNIDAPSQPETIQWINYNNSTPPPYMAWGLIAPNGFRVRYPNCMGTFSGGSALILPDGPGACSALATNQAALAYLYSGLGENAVTLEALATNFTSAVPVLGQDFVTIAYYAYQPGYEPNNYGLRFVSVDPNRYYLR